MIGRINNWIRWRMWRNQWAELWVAVGWAARLDRMSPGKGVVYAREVFKIVTKTGGF